MFIPSYLKIKMPAMLSVLIYLAIGSGNVTAAAQQIELSQTRQVPWGIYQILWNTEQFERELDEQLAQLGGSPRYVLFFRDLNRVRGFPRNAIEICHARNLIPVISFEPAPWHARDDERGLADIAAGRYDDYFRQWGLDAARWGQPVIFRFGFEMNGDWFSWGQKPEKFKKAWRRIHRLFRKAEAHNVIWMFSANVAPLKSNLLQNPLTYYPGDSFVDLVAVDGYNFGDHYSQWHQWESYSAVFNSTLTVLSGLNKPLFISEIGCAADKRKPLWIEDFLNRVSSNPRIEGFIYYNYYPKRRGYPNWRLDSDNATLRVFRKWAFEQACMNAVPDIERCSQ